MKNKILSFFLVLTTTLVSYPFIDQVGLVDKYLVIFLIILILSSIGSLIYNFCYRQITPVITILLIINLIIGLCLLYYVSTVVIME